MKRLLQKIKAVDYLGTTCNECGQAYHFSAMQFHHINPNEKHQKLSSMLGRYSWKKIKSELDKCALLCSNCHHVLHYKEHMERKHNHDM